MRLKARVTTEWLRKGRRVEDTKILRKLVDDSSDWKIANASLSEIVFQKALKLKPLPKTTLDPAIINDILGQGAVTEIVRTNKNDLTPKGDDLRQQVASLLPSKKTLTKEEKNSLSYVFSRIVSDEILSAFKWPVVPEGLDSLSAALYTINIIAHQTGNRVRWLLPIWTLKTNDFKLRQLRRILETIDSNGPQVKIMESAKKEIESFLGKDSFSGQDPLSNKIDAWREAITNLESSEDDLGKARKQLAQSRRGVDVEQKTIKEHESEIERLEQVILKHKATIKKNHSALENEIQNLRTHNQLLTQWNVNTLHPGGPTSHSLEYLLKNIRNELNILNYEPLIRMCEVLRTIELPGRPTATDLSRELGLKQRMANYALVRFGYLLNENYIFSPSTVDLRYRFILTKNQKPGVLQDGLVERLTMQLNDEYSGCTVHLEPTSSSGPRDEQVPAGALQFIADSEVISMRLNLYDLNERRWDMSSAYETDPLTKSVLRDTPKWLYRTTGTPSPTQNNLSPMEVDILGILSVFRGLRLSRMWLFDQLGHNQVTSRRYLKRLLDRDIFRLLYLPSLEFCGLPVGLMVGGQFKNEKSRKMLTEWMTSKLPYARLFLGNSTDLVAYLRLPADATTTIRAILRESFESTASKWFVSGVMTNQTYHLTVFHRLNKNDCNGWIDPWRN